MKGSGVGKKLGQREFSSSEKQGLFICLVDWYDHSSTPNRKLVLNYLTVSNYFYSYLQIKNVLEIKHVQYILFADQAVSTKSIKYFIFVGNLGLALNSNNNLLLNLKTK